MRSNREETPAWSGHDQARAGRTRWPAALRSSPLTVGRWVLLTVTARFPAPGLGPPGRGRSPPWTPRPGTPSPAGPGPGAQPGARTRPPPVRPRPQRIRLGGTGRPAAPELPIRPARQARGRPPVWGGTGREMG